MLVDLCAFAQNMLGTELDAVFALFASFKFDSYLIHNLYNLYLSGHQRFAASRAAFFAAFFAAFSALYLGSSSA